MSEGVMEGLLALAGRRRGWTAAEGMLEVDRGYVPCSWRIGARGILEGVRACEHAATPCDSRLSNGVCCVFKRAWVRLLSVGGRW